MNGMPLALNRAYVASNWGNDRYMSWNTRAGKSEVFMSAETRLHVFILSGNPLGKVAETT